MPLALSKTLRCIAKLVNIIEYFTGCYSESVNEETDQSQKTEVEVANEEFERFIASALTNYSDWIKDKNRDPAHVPTESRIKEQNFEIEFVIR